MWVDHILPEKLVKTPQQLQVILAEYDLDPGFTIDDYGNWLPAHWRCNLEKGQTIFERGAALYYISLAQSKSGKAREYEERVIRGLKADKLLGSLEIAVNEGLLSRDEIAAIISGPQQRKSHETAAGLMQAELVEAGFDKLSLRKSCTVITFGLTVETVLNSRFLDPNIPRAYPALCDWLEKNLIQQLKKSLSCEFYYPEASSRDGETLSVRLAFVELQSQEIEMFSSPWWEVLEIANFGDIYEDSA